MDNFNCGLQLTSKLSTKHISFPDSAALTQALNEAFEEAGSSAYEPTNTDTQDELVDAAADAFVIVE